MSHAISRQVESLRQRLSRRRLAAGVCWTLAATLGVALLLGWCDYLIRSEDRGLRILASAAWLGAIAWAAWRFLLPAVRPHLSQLAVAQRIEQRHPELRDRLSSSLNFLEQREDDPTAGSAALRRAVIGETTDLLLGVTLDDVVARGPLRRAATWLTWLFAFVFVCWLLDGEGARTAARRLTAPWDSASWPRTHHLAFRDAPTQLAVGSVFEVELMDTQGDLPDDVRIHYRTVHRSGQPIASEPMRPAGEIMVARRENVTESFEFRATGGDDYSMPWQRVDVVDPPHLASLNILARPPDYTGLPIEKLQNHIRVWEGTRLTLEGETLEDVTAANVRLEDGTQIPAELTAKKGPGAARQLRTAPESWIAQATSRYWVELVSATGLTGASQHWNLRVDPDTPPSVSWQEPTGDQYVTAAARLPITLAVKDNLAIQSVDLAYQRSDQSAPDPHTINIYQGPTEFPAAAQGVPPGGETRVVEYAWDLAPLELPVGAQLTVQAQATDYRPGTGHTVAPRLITIITTDELEQRLADQQARIVARLEQALTMQRTAREQVRRLEMRQLNSPQLAPGDRDNLQATTISQRLITNQLSDPTDGIPANIADLVDRLRSNRVESPSIVTQMQQLRRALDELAAGPLPAVRRELTTAGRLGGDSENPQAAELQQALSRAGSGQDEIIGVLETLLGEVSSWTTHQQFARDVAQLRRDQLALRETTAAELDPEETTNRSRDARDQQASRESAARAQADLSRRFQKLQQAIRQMADELTDKDSVAAATLSDAASESQSLGTVEKLSDAARNMRAGRIGRALDQQQQAADDLEQILGTLRNRRESELQSLVQKLRQAEQDLARLQDDLAELQKEISRAPGQGSEPDQQRERTQLRTQADDTREQIERMARRLNRLQAENAARTASQAADHLAESSENSDPPSDSPPSSEQTAAAEQDLEQAAQQLDARRRQAEADLAEQQMARLESALRAMIGTQQRIVDDTRSLEELRQKVGKLSYAQTREVVQLADDERLLHEEALAFANLLANMGAFQLTLADAAESLIQAAELLELRDTATTTQRAERQALTRLKQIATALQREPPAETPPQSEGGSGSPAGDSEDNPSTLDLAELKLLRIMQQELNRQTRTLAEDLAGQEDPQKRRQQADDLAEQQRTLAELVLQVILRDNESDKQ